MKSNSVDVRKLVGIGVLTAIVLVLQLAAIVIRFGPFAISLVLIPIVVGAALYGVAAGAWLGFVFGAAVLISGDAAPFLAVNPAGTVITVLAKGTLAGLIAGAVYRAASKKNRTVGTICAAVTAPVVNTGVFLLGCVLFFMETIRGWGEAAGFDNVGTYMIVGFVGLNFLVELLINVVLSPIIVKLIGLGKKNA